MLAIPKSIAMDENLQSLIKHYEAEQYLLQNLLGDCLLKEDYKFARYYHKNINALQKTLYNLYCLTDYNHAEKTEVLRTLANIKKRSSDDSFYSFREQSLNEYNDKLSRLNNLPVKEVEEKYDLENAIIRLLENDIKGFKLYIFKKFNFYIKFSLQVDDIIHMEFTPFKEFNEYFEFDAFEIKTLQNMGFILNNDMLFIDFDFRQDSLKSVKILLARIFFEIFRWRYREIVELVIY